MTRHVITNISTEARRCDCSICGQGVPLRVRNRSGRTTAYTCRTAESGTGPKGPTSPESKRRSQLKRYGLTLEDFARLRSEQQGRCVVCRRTADDLVVDHCHATGRVRGLLCRLCNVGLGLFQDDPERLRRAAAYVEPVVMPR